MTEQITEQVAKPLDEAKLVADEQALDEGLWFVAETAPEAYLQRALRRLHHAVEFGIDPGEDLRSIRPWPYRAGGNA